MYVLDPLRPPSGVLLPHLLFLLDLLFLLLLLRLLLVRPFQGTLFTRLPFFDIAADSFAIAPPKSLLEWAKGT